MSQYQYLQLKSISNYIFLFFIRKYILVFKENATARDRFQNVTQSNQIWEDSWTWVFDWKSSFFSWSRAWLLYVEMEFGYFVFSNGFSAYFDDLDPHYLFSTGLPPVAAIANKSIYNALIQHQIHDPHYHLPWFPTHSDPIPSHYYH